MYKSEPLTRRGSLRSLRSAPLLSTLLESTLSLSRIHPITSLELPGLDYAIESQSVIGGHHRELGTSLRTGIAAIATSSHTQSHSVSAAARLGRLGTNSSFRHTLGGGAAEHVKKRVLQPKRALSRKLKPHIVADTVKQYISRAQRIQKDTKEQQPNMEFLRGVYAFMQIDCEYETSTDFESQIVTAIPETITTSTTTTKPTTATIPNEIRETKAPATNTSTTITTLTTNKKHNKTSMTSVAPTTGSKTISTSSLSSATTSAETIPTTTSESTANTRVPSTSTTSNRKLKCNPNVVTRCHQCDNHKNTHTHAKDIEQTLVKIENRLPASACPQMVDGQQCEQQQQGLHQVASKQELNVKFK